MISTGLHYWHIYSSHSELIKRYPKLTGIALLLLISFLILCPYILILKLVTRARRQTFEIHRLPYLDSGDIPEAVMYHEVVHHNWSLTSAPKVATERRALQNVKVPGTILYDDVPSSRPILEKRLEDLKVTLRDTSPKYRF